MGSLLKQLRTSAEEVGRSEAMREYHMGMEDVSDHAGEAVKPAFVNLLVSASKVHAEIKAAYEVFGAPYGNDPLGPMSWLHDLNSAHDDLSAQGVSEFQQVS